MSPPLPCHLLELCDMKSLQTVETIPNTVVTTVSADASYRWMLSVGTA